MSNDGRDARRLVEGTAPRWSPDGSRFAYIVQDHGKTRYIGTSIWVMNPDTGGTRRVANAESIWALAWAPDGVRLAYTDPSRIFVVDTETGDTELVSIEIQVHGLDWSPDGRRLLLAAGPVKLLDIQTGAERYVAPHTDGGRWSPGGEHMAFTHVAPLPLSRKTRKFVVVAEQDGGNGKRVTSGGWDSDAAWSHDGEQIYFSRLPRLLGTAAESEIYAVELERGSLRRLTEDRFADRLPDPRPARRLSTEVPKPAAGDVVVPDLAGRNVQFADERRRFAELGLGLKTVWLPPKYGLLGYVREQVPRGGSRVAKGTVVKLDVGDMEVLYGSGAFSARVWKAHTDCREDSNPRGAMYVDLVRRVLRRGMPRARVLALLGDPERAGGRTLEWPLGRTSYVRVDCISLRVEFDRRGNATRFYQSQR